MFNPNQQYPALQQSNPASPVMAAMLQQAIMNKQPDPSMNNAQQLNLPQIGGQGGMPNQLLQPQGMGGLTGQALNGLQVNSGR